MMKKITKLLALTLCICLVAGTTAQAEEAQPAAQSSAQAAPDYSAVFDADYYRNTYPDVAGIVGGEADKLLQHFIAFGMREGRTGRPEFNVRAYMKNNLDLVAVFGAGDLSAYYTHYMLYGRAEGRSGMYKDNAPKEGQLASFSTAYNVAEDRAVNVQIASDHMNGIVIQPGGAFSFSDSVLPRTTANGYVVAPSFAGGRVVSSVGGGICQVSSTLYVTMLLSCIPATERYPHSLYVDYVPVGLDAAIAQGYKDLRFVNPYPYPIRIESVTKDGILTVGIYRAENTAQ